MIYFDCTKTAHSRHNSGLVRVSSQLRRELGEQIVEAVWKGGWKRLSGEAVQLTASDWLLTPELFSEAERPGFQSFLSGRSCRLAAIFHDAIPLQHPHMTWPQSVGRHPEYMTMLSRFDRVFAVSSASAADLQGFWFWQGTKPQASVTTLQLGADGAGVPRLPVANTPLLPPLLLCLGIVEPRKNQTFVADLIERALGAGLDCSMRFIGRVNPHFGGPVADRLARLSRQFPQVRHDTQVSDEELSRLWSGAYASVFATRAEGCGLPLLESLWRGVPCLCSDLEPLVENAQGGGCVTLSLDDPDAWFRALERLLQDAAFYQRLRAEAAERELPAWADTANALRRALAS